MTELPIIVWSPPTIGSWIGWESDESNGCDQSRHRRARPLGQGAHPRASANPRRSEIVPAFSRSRGEARRLRSRSSASQRCPISPTLLADPEIKGVILTVPNEQHLPLAREVAKAGKHVYTEKPIASTLEEGLEIEALEKRYGVTVTVGHSARLMAGIRAWSAPRSTPASSAASPSWKRISPTSARSSSRRRPGAGTRHRAPGGPLSQLAIHQFDVLHYLGGEIVEASSMASKLSPVGAEVDDQSMTLLQLRRRQDRLCRLVLDVARHLLRCGCSAPRA